MVKALLLNSFLSACCGDPEEDNSERLVAATKCTKTISKVNLRKCSFGSNAEMQPSGNAWPAQRGQPT
eukprot:UN19849